MIWFDGRALFKCRNGGGFVPIGVIDMALIDRDVMVAGMGLPKRLIQVLSLFCLPDRKASRSVSLFNLIIVLGLLLP